MCFRDVLCEWEYEFAFDMNAKDVTGQSPFYLACYVGNQKIVDILLKFKVKANSVKVTDSVT